MSELFQYQFLQIALAGALLSAASTALLSVFISLKKISFMGEALAHVSFAGIALALLLGLHLQLTVLLFVAATALLIGLISLRGRMAEANITTIFLSVSMAVAIILIRLQQNYTFDLAGYLFGNILLIGWHDLAGLAVLLVANLAFLLLFFKELFYMTYNYEMAAVYRIPVKGVYYLFLLFLAANIVITVKTVGIILITAQLILPGITALNFVRSIKPAILLSVLIAELASFCGLLLSYYLDLPSGATIVLLLFAFFLLSLAAGRLLRRRQRKAPKTVC